MGGARRNAGLLLLVLSSVLTACRPQDDGAPAADAPGRASLPAPPERREEPEPEPALEPEPPATPPPANVTPLNIAPLSITVRADRETGTIHDHLYGYNHVWIRGGNGVWDTDRYRLNEEVIEALKPLGATLLRFPGGTLSHRYRWLEGIGPPAKRPPGRALAHMSTFSNAYGTLEFLEVCRALGECDPLFVANWDEGSPREAAAWLSFLNGSPDNPLALGKDSGGRDWKTVGFWARRRVELGLAEPIGVPYFEIGNELYWKRFSATAEEYAEKFLLYHDLLKKVDPTVEVGAVGFHKPHGFGNRDAEEQTGKPWNRTLLSRVGPRCDFLTVHVYRGLAEETDDGYPDLVLTPIDLEKEILEIRRLADEIRGEGVPRLKIAITEYNAMIRENDAFSPKMVNHGAALYNASLLLAFARAGVEIGSFHILCLLPPEDPKLASGIHFAALAIHPDRMIKSPTYHVLSLLTAALRGRMLEVSADPRPLGSGHRGDEVPVLDVAASAPSPEELTVVILNRSLTEALPVTIRVEGDTIRPFVRHTILAAPSPDASNQGAFPAVSPVTVHPVPQDSSTISFPVPPLSLNVVRMQRD